MYNRTLTLIDRLDAKLYRVLCEVQFAGSLLNLESRSTLEIDSGNLAIVIDQIVMQLEAARCIARRLDDATRPSKSRARRRGKSAGKTRIRSDG